ncbi:peptide-methionine (S)-S-oxide reductase MsrA [Marinilactibacillus psychrotolerans]|uniref:Peptide methionine sulfoxide reductase MsrA n=2 Tax=Marinilactibacillus psychrotolerans TaxID=191770 RepID=A0ABW8UFC1_9LACT|nr:peptide-methionine (S)-S-oxide reductase MsrA [Marinilactibacillus psychrotolerans]
MEKALFAGGCFWCMVEPFEDQDGILSVTSGYTGGHVEDPTYEQVKSQTTGHTEAVEIVFDPEKMSFEELVEIYWNQTDPTDAMGQFMDRGDSYRPVIFYLNEKQKQIAESSKLKLEQSGRYSEPIVTKIQKAEIFYRAEEEHQEFYKKNPRRYKQEKMERFDWQEAKKESGSNK